MTLAFTLVQRVAGGGGDGVAQPELHIVTNEHDGSGHATVFDRLQFPGLMVVRLQRAAGKTPVNGVAMRSRMLARYRLVKDRSDPMDGGTVPTSPVFPPSAR